MFIDKKAAVGCNSKKQFLEASSQPSTNLPFLGD